MLQGAGLCHMQHQLAPSPQKAAAAYLTALVHQGTLEAHHRGWLGTTLNRKLRAWLKLTLEMRPARQYTSHFSNTATLQDGKQMKAAGLQWHNRLDTALPLTCTCAAVPCMSLALQIALAFSCNFAAAPCPDQHAKGALP